jgi:hypothetical protein
MEVTNMTAGAVAGFVFRQWAESKKQQHAVTMALAEKNEEGMEKAASRGGVWVRRILISAVVLAMLSAVVAGFLNQEVVLENEITKNFLGLFKWDKLKYVTVDGVVILKENRTAFEQMIGFYFGQAIK